MSAVSTIVGAAVGPFKETQGQLPSASESLEIFQQQSIEKGLTNSAATTADDVVTAVSTQVDIAA